jgi:uncharacterized protein with HEPN domain
MSEERREYLLFLEDILRSIEKIVRFSQGLTLEQLKANDMILDAVVRNFEIIGEAVKNVPKTVKEKYPDVEWKEAAGFRDVLIHDYFGIEIEAVWDTIKKNIRPFREHIEEVLKVEQQSKKRKIRH